MGAQMSQHFSSARMDVKTRLAEVRKLTSAASKLRINKRKDKIVQASSKDEKPVKDGFKESPPKKDAEEKQVKLEDRTTKVASPVQQQQDVLVRPRAASTSSKPVLPSKAPKGLPHHIVAATRVERKWTLTDLLQNLGIFVQKHCTHLHTIPSASEVAMWVRCADRALQLNGWTINSFLLESHVVFTYMLLNSAFDKINIRTLTDVKELVLLCLYVSYTYNANEISYPLKPFLVKQDRAGFWDKCTSVSLRASGSMLKLNRDHMYYADTLTSLKRVTSVH